VKLKANLEPIILYGPSTLITKSLTSFIEEF
jgi:hypothetical protein